jgi:hypothetical protein
MPKMSISIPDPLWDEAVRVFGPDAPAWKGQMSYSGLIQEVIKVALKNRGSSEVCPLCNEVAYGCEGHSTTEWMEYANARAAATFAAAERERKIINREEE